MRPTGRRSTCPRRRASWSPGYMTEYSSLKFAALHALRVRRDGDHVGGHHHAVPRRLAGARGRSPLWAGANSGWWPMLWFFGKVVAAGLRLRLGCGARCPGCATTSSCGSAGRCCCRSTWSGSWSWPACASIEDWEHRAAPAARRRRRRPACCCWSRCSGRAASRSRSRRSQEQVDSRPHGSFPLPPMDLQVPPSPRTRRVVAEREPANVGRRLATPREV